MDTIFCDLCNGLTIAKLYPPNVYHHGESLTVLEQSGKTCRLCMLIYWSISVVRWREKRPQLHFEGATEDEISYRDEAHRRCSVKLQILPGERDRTGKANEIRHVGIWTRSKYMVAELSLLVEEGDKLGTRAWTVNGIDCYIAGRVLANKFPPEAQFDLAKAWLNDCEANHPDCLDKTSLSPELPRRVIDVGSLSQEPRLVDGIGHETRYATLSHCWGRLPTMKTEMDSLRQRQRSIPLAKLPKTFKEAVVTCRKLQIPYIWIDSLCIIQNNKEEWEYHSSIMGSIFYNSTLTIAATDASDSSDGLFIPTLSKDYPSFNIIALPPSFAENQGQVYARTPTWSDSTSPISYVASGVLQSRGWVMQERYLSPRTLHFLKGQMVWECSQIRRGQGGFVDTRPDLIFPLRMVMKTFERALKGSYTFAWREDVGEGHNGNEEAKTLPASNVISQHGVGTKTLRQDVRHIEECISGIRKARTEDGRTWAGSAGEENKGIVRIFSYPRTSRIPDTISPTNLPFQHDDSLILVTPHNDPVLYTFLNLAIRQTVYHVWYGVVRVYSDRRLTFASDKLPALAGIASRVHAITKDRYLAGHWHKELERSLFWRTEVQSDTGHPGRVKDYRAPSWSWASVNATTKFDFPDLTSGLNTPAPLEVVDVSVEVDGENPFGCVSGGQLIIKATTTLATWNESSRSWLLKGKLFAYGKTEFDDLKFIDADDCIVGIWNYDDAVNGILPGPPIVQSTPIGDVRSRSVPSVLFGSVITSNHYIHGKDSNDNRTLWKRGTYVPEDLVLVKGPTREWDGEETDGECKTIVEVLILARTESPGNEYRRVGVGKLGSWDATVESEETLTVV